MTPLHPILLVEDSADDALLMRRVFEKLHLANPLTVVEDGHRAVTWLETVLSGTAGARAIRPVLVLLDLKLPRRSGLEVLAWIRQQPDLASCPVVVLTSSREAPDVQGAYELGANSYLIKPVSQQALFDLVASLDLNWQIAPR